jgi:hypothetical protein
MADTTFDPGTADTGKDKSVSLVLPDAATSIKAADLSNPPNIEPTFKYFSVLKSVSGSKIITVGGVAFAGCAALTTVNLPEAPTISDAAFGICTHLAEVYLPKAATIGEAAFLDCQKLETVTLPKAATIGGGAFYTCIALTEVDLPAAMSIGSNAFEGCTALTTVSLGSTAPTTLGINMFFNIYSSKTVTVKVPTSATGYGTSPTNTTDKIWGNGFRGGGWNGSTSTTTGGTVNSNITLVIQ